MNVVVIRTGDWGLAERIAGACARDVKAALRTVIRQEAEDCRSAMVEGIIAGAPGGQRFKPLAATTLAFRRAAAAGKAISSGAKRESGIRAGAQSRANERSRTQMMANARAISSGSNRGIATAQRQATRANTRAAASLGRQIRRSQMSTMGKAISAGMKVGTKPLIQSGDLLGSIRAVHKGDTSFIGILRTAKTKDGKSLFNVARIHEFGGGPKAVKMSPKQRAFLAVMFKRIGTVKVGKGGGGVLTIRIPARPFVRPVFEALYGDDLNTMKRIARRLAELLPLTPKL